MMVTLYPGKSNNFTITTDANLPPIDKWTTIQISQELLRADPQKFLVTLGVAGRGVPGSPIENLNPMDFKDIKVTSIFIICFILFFLGACIWRRLPGAERLHQEPVDPDQDSRYACQNIEYI